MQLDTRIHAVCINVQISEKDCYYVRMMALFGDPKPKADKPRRADVAPSGNKTDSPNKKREGGRAKPASAESAPKKPGKAEAIKKPSAADKSEDALTTTPETKKPERTRQAIPRISDTIDTAYGPDGKKAVLIDPKGNLTPSQISGMYTSKGLAKHTIDGFKKDGMLKELPSLKDVPIDQITKLKKDIVVAGGSADSSRKVLAEHMVKLLTTECDLKAMQATGVPKDLIPLLKLWTWLSSPGHQYVLGDEKRYYGKFGSEPNDSEKRKAEASRRKEAYAAYIEKDGVREELVTRIQNHIGRELDDVCRWAFNSNVDVRRKKYQKDNKTNKVPVEPRFTKLSPENNFPRNGLLAYLLRHSIRKQGEQAARDNILALLYPHKYARFAPTPLKERPKKKKPEKTAAKPAEVAKKPAKAELTDAEKKLVTLRPKIAQMQERMAKASALAKLLVADAAKDHERIRGRLKFISDRVGTHLLTQQSQWMEQALLFLPETERRTLVGKLLGKKNDTPPVKQGDFDSLTTQFDNIEKRQWFGVEKDFREIFKRIEKPRFLDPKFMKEFNLDALDAQDLKKFVSNLKREFNERPPEAKRRAEVKGQEVVAFLQNVRPQLEARIKASPGKKGERTPLRIALTGQLESLNELLDMKIKMPDEERARRLVNAYNRFLGRGYKKHIREKA